MITDQRDGSAVFEHLAKSLVGGGVQHIIFTTYKRDNNTESRNSMQLCFFLVTPLLTLV